MTMKQTKSKTRNHDITKDHVRRTRRRPQRLPEPLEVEPELPVDALLEIADYALDTALTATYGDPDDVAAVERIRRYMHGTLRGFVAERPTESDFMTMLALAVASLEKRHGIVGLGETVASTIDHLGFVAPQACAYHRAPRLVTHLRCVP
jgi:hypothetical protein